jgi:hypothetical protein
MSTSATSAGQTVEGVQAEEVSFDLGDGMVMAAKVSVSNMDQASFYHLLWRDMDDYTPGRLHDRTLSRLGRSAVNNTAFGTYSLCLTGLGA